MLAVAGGECDDRGYGAKVAGAQFPLQVTPTDSFADWKPDLLGSMSELSMQPSISFLIIR
jgi:hypothetical protein